MKKNLFMLLVAATGVFSVACSDSKNNGPDVPVAPQVDVTLTPSYTLGGFAPKILMGTDAFAMVFSTVPVDGDAKDPIVSGAGEVLFLQLGARMSEEGVLPQTTYKVTLDYENGFKPRTVLGAYCSYFNTNADGTPNKETGFYVSAGTVEVSREGTQYTIVANVTITNEAEGSKTFYMSYTGDIDIKKSPYSPLKEDKKIDLEFMPGALLFAANKIGGGFDTWNINLYTAEDKSDGMQIVLHVPAGTTGKNTGIPAGTYEVGTFKDKTVVVPGVMDFSGGGSSLTGTWYVSEFLDGIVGAQAPATSGTLIVSKKEDGEYTVSFDFVDDNFKTCHFTGNWTGIPSVNVVE